MSYRPGDYYAVCDVCGLRGYASEMRMQWNNLFVHAATCYDPKHEQYVEPTGKHEKQTVKPHRPEQEDNFIETPITGDDL